MCDHPNREAAMVVVERAPDGTPTVWCDPCLAPLVSALNAGGIPTVASCCGHGTQHGSIVLADGRDLRIHEFVPDESPNPAEEETPDDRTGGPSSG